MPTFARLYAQNWKIKDIAKEVNMRPETVARKVKEFFPPAALGKPGQRTYAKYFLQYLKTDSHYEPIRKAYRQYEQDWNSL